jgi:3-dehydroquinate synthase
MKSSGSARSGKTSARPIIEIGDGVRFRVGDIAKRCLDPDTRRIHIVSNRKVSGYYGKDISKSLRKAGFELSQSLVIDGERAKSFSGLQKVLEDFSRASIRRTDACLALGGGVVGDLAGVASSVYLRGIQFIQVPTTLIAQIDASIGGKTAINSRYAKNQIGTFYEPSFILTDVAVLETLPGREFASGLYEAIKHGAVGNRKLFNETKDFIEEFPLANLRKSFAQEEFRRRLREFVSIHADFKARLVSADLREKSSRADRRSRKILNFGHTIGHALEQVSSYKHFRHGEAIGIGMLVAAEISKSLGILRSDELKLLNDAIESVGQLPPTKDIEPKHLLAALESDKKIIGNSLQWILLESIGKPKIFRHEEIGRRVISSAIFAVLGRSWNFSQFED